MSGLLVTAIVVSWTVGVAVGALLVNEIRVARDRNRRERAHLDVARSYGDPWLWPKAPRSPFEPEDGFGI